MYIPLGEVCGQTHPIMISKKQWFLIGVTSGVLLSLVVTPLVEDCHRWSDSEEETNWYSLIANSDFNPVVRLNRNKTESRFDQKDINQRVFRPKYYSQELEIKDNLLICVYLSSNASKASYLLNDTIGQTSAKVMLFHDRSVGSVTTGDSIEVPFVSSTPKYLNLLQYLFDSNIVRNFNFVFIVSDKTYINPNVLLRLFRSYSVSQNLFVSPLITHKTNDLNDLIQFNYNPSHSLDSGMIFSTSLLLKCNLDKNCLKPFQNSYHERDVNPLLSYHLKPSPNPNADRTALDIDIITNSLTIFPVKDENTYKRLKLILCKKSIEDSLQRLDTLEEQIVSSTDGQSINEWPLGVEPPVKATNRFEVIRWSYFNESHAFMPNDFDVILPVSDIEAKELSQIKAEGIQWLQSQYKDLILDDIRIVDLYKKFDAFRGLEYILDFRLNAFPEIKRLQVIKPFNKVELVSGVPYVTENVRIVLILPVRSGAQTDHTSSFLSQYSTVCLSKTGHRTVLILVFIHKAKPEDDPYLKIKSEATQMQSKYKNSGARIAWIQITSAKENRVPSELAYMDLIAKRLSQTFSDALLLHCRPNMILSVDYLNRVRLNTIQSHQVFFPIPFVEYRIKRPNPSKVLIVRKDSGYFESTNYDFNSFYLSDYLKARKAIQRTVPIVRNEYFLKRDIYYGSGVDFHHLFVQYNQIWLKNKGNTKLFIMRSIEPELKVKATALDYNCLAFESNIFTIENCRKRNVFGLGTRPQLAALVMNESRESETRINHNSNALNDLPLK